MALNSVIVILLLISPTVMSIANITKPYPEIVNSTFVIEVVRSIHKVYGFKNFIFYISERLVWETDKSAEFFLDFWDAFPTRPIVIGINNAMRMSGFLSTPSLCFVLTTEHDDPIMEMAALSLKGVRYLKTIFILFPMVRSQGIYNNFLEYKRFYENVRLIYDWAWKKQFTNTMLITLRNNVYIHDPYPTPTIVNKTANWTVADFFIKYDSDFKGYPIKAPTRYDLPRVFHMTRHSSRRRKDYVSGVSGKIFKAFVSAIHANFNESLTDGKESEAADIDDMIRMVEEKHLEISPHSYTHMHETAAGQSYPIGINDWCIMVPFRKRSPDNLYLQHGFHELTWTLMCLSVFYIAIGIWFCNPQAKRDLSLSFLQAICSMVLIPPLSVITGPSVRLRYIFVLLFLMGFFMTNLYISKLTSFLTAFPSQAQINTVEDVMAAELPIMMLEFEYEMLKEKNYPKEFLELAIRVPKHQMDLHRDRLNTSYGYSVQTDRWNFLNRMQRYLRKPLFRLSSICLGPFYHGFPIQKDSHLERPLKVFLMEASQLGFLEYWEKEAFADALFLGYVHMILVIEYPLPLSMSYFRSVYLVWWLGMMVSGVVFCLEVKGVTWNETKDKCGKYVRRLKKIVMN